MFIASALIGIVTEPVITNRKPAVSVSRIASASGMREAIADFWSAKNALAPPTSAWNPARASARSLPSSRRWTSEYGEPWGSSTISHVPRPR